MPILYYSTQIKAEKTVHEIASILGQGGASNISFEYANRIPTAVYFTIALESGVKANFRLPQDTDGVLAAFERDKIPRSFRNRSQAERTAWRIVKSWVASQMAIIEAGQAKMIQVFLPYAVTHGGKTLFEHFENEQFKLLGEGDE